MTLGFLDIISTSPDPRAQALSNFAAWTFIVDGITCNCMEGFLQSLKIPDLEKQQAMCLLDGRNAHREGQQYNQWKDNQMLYWNNRVYPRASQQYKDLLTRAYQALSDQNVSYADNLKSTYPLRLTHTIGKTNPKDTLLTANEFCNILTDMRLHLVFP